ncbi:hypothetical protein [Streptomyces sp. NPDC003710]
MGNAVHRLGGGGDGLRSFPLPAPRARGDGPPKERGARNPSTDPHLARYPDDEWAQLATAQLTGVRATLAQLSK